MTKTKTKTSSLLSAAIFPIALLAPYSLVAQSATASLNSIDRIVGEQQSGGPGLGYYADVADARIGIGGASGARSDSNAVLGFELPTLPVGETVETVTISFEITKAFDQTGNGIPQLHVYLLDTADPATSGTTYFYHGPENGTPSVPFVGGTMTAVAGTIENTYADGIEKRTFVLTGDALALFQSFYDPVGQAGLREQRRSLASHSHPGTGRDPRADNSNHRSGRRTL